MKLRMLALPLLFMTCEVNLFSGQQSPAPATGQDSAVAYPDTSEGLQDQVTGILTAIKEKNSAKEANLIHNLLMPDDGK